MKKTLTVILSIVILLALGGLLYFFRTYKSVSVPPTATPDASNSLAQFSLPEGFHMSVYAENVPGARVIAFDPKGVMLVSESSKGAIVALPDTDGDGVADAVLPVLSGLNNPHGMAFKCEGDLEMQSCKLYVAEKNALDVFAYDPATRQATDKQKLLDLPDGGGHTTRTLLFKPAPDDSTLLISVGSSCNVCNETDGNRAKILSYDVKTGKSEVYASGLRNSVFLDVHPVTGAIWATDMGRDGLGDDIPPDEINVITKGANYGWPICFGKNVHDADYDKNVYIRNPCMAPLETPSYIDIPAHSAPLGFAFVPEEGWPQAYWYDLILAYHGSWNRSTATGYKVVRMKLDVQGKPTGEFEDFITGWLRSDGTKIGRPVDVKALPGGVMYVSDDGAGRIYRVTANQ